MEAIEVLKQMAGGHTDEQIATTLNRLGLQTGAGHTWNEQRVYSASYLLKDKKKAGVVAAKLPGKEGT